MRQRSKSGVDSLLGQVIDGRYRLQRRIGQGGMGVVYEAEHVGLDKRVALKFLLEKYTEDDEALARFRREARTASRIGHDNIVDITDIGETDDGRSYIVMEFLEGADLSQLLRQTGPLDGDRAASIIAQVLDGLHAAHRKGIVHRDMKPENVFLVRRADGTEVVKIMDFGISKIIDAHDSKVRLTETGMVLGTPIYMAPEQAQAVPNIDFRADIYAVGCMLFELIAGRPPFEGTHYLGLVTQHLYEPVPALSSLRPDVSPALESAVTRALSKEPRERWNSAADLAAVLRGADHAHTIPAAGVGPVDTQAPPASTGDRAVAGAAPTTHPTRDHARRSKAPYLMVGGAAVIAAAMVAFAFVTSQNQEPPHPPEPARSERTPPPTAGAASLADAAAPTVDELSASLEIDSSPPGATVIVDGVEHGQTPLTLDEIAVGSHGIRLELDGYEPLVAQKRVRAGYRETFVGALASEVSGEASTAETGGRPSRAEAPAPEVNTDARRAARDHGRPARPDTSPSRHDGETTASGDGDGDGDGNGNEASPEERDGDGNGNEASPEERDGDGNGNEASPEERDGDGNGNEASPEERDIDRKKNPYVP